MQSSERKLTFYKRRLLALLSVALLALLIVHTLGPAQSAADGSGTSGAYGSSAPSSSAPPEPRPCADIGPRCPGQLRYEANLECQDEGCAGIAAPLPSGVAAGGRVGRCPGSQEAVRPGDTCPGGASICPRYCP